MHNEFKENFKLSNVSVSEGNYTLRVSKNRNKLLIGCIEGLYIVSLDNMNKICEIHMNQRIECLDFYNEECISCITIKKGEIFIKQYLLNKDFRGISKFSEKKIYSRNNINFIKIIKNKIFYLNDSNSVHYYENKWDLIKMSHFIKN